LSLPVADWNRDSELCNALQHSTAQQHTVSMQVPYIAWLATCCGRSDWWCLL